jgi:CBS-domain-containing membrane protein
MKVHPCQDVTSTSLFSFSLPITHPLLSEFRTLGLRHMVVINDDHQVVGIITRKDITNKTLRAHWEAQVYLPDPLLSLTSTG